MLKSELISKAISFFTAKGYQVQMQTDLLFVFISEKREVNWLIFLVACCLGIIPGAIYYFLFCPRHQVTISMTGQEEVSVVVTGTTEDAKRDAAEFQKLIG
jgi:hypothetical protein